MSNIVSKQCQIKKIGTKYTLQQIENKVIANTVNWKVSVKTMNRKGKQESQEHKQY